MEVRTRVLRDQLGVKLAKEAGVNFDALPTVAIVSPPDGGSGERPRTRSGALRENRGPKRAMPGRPDRGTRGGESRFEREAAPRRAPPAPSTPERRRKHVSALRAEIAADAATTRKRVERSATHDRRGRTIAVERMSRAHEETRIGAAPETGPRRTGRPHAGERGGGKPNSFGPKRARGPEGRERPPRSDHKEGGHRPERPNPARRGDGPCERRFDRPPAKRDGDRRDGLPRTHNTGDPTRERKFDRPEARTRPPGGEGRPPRSEDKSRGPRSDFKSRLPRGGARDGDRAQGRGPGGQGGSPRGRSSPERRPRPPGKGPPKGGGGSRRPPRKP